MGPIQTLTDRCRKCYSCVRNCPVKAIRVRKDCAEVLHPRCIGCGKCIKVCSQQAKVIADQILTTLSLLSGKTPVVAVLGGSYPSSFASIRPGQLVEGLKRLGFCEVHEGTSGAELIAAEYRRLLKTPSSRPLISSHCPTIVDLIERHYPQLGRNLAPVVSPMVAAGRLIKTRRPGQTRVVYISSCIAGKFEVEAEEVAGAIDTVLTYNELTQIFADRGMDLTRLPEGSFDGLPPELGRLFPIPGGPFRNFGTGADLLDADFISTEGEDSALELIQDLAAGRVSPKLADIRFCRGGCVGGPGKNNRLTTFTKRDIILAYIGSRVPYRSAAHYLQPGETPPTGRTFHNKLHRLESPGADAIRRTLEETNKFSPRDELNCASCGYRSCRELAVAVHQGLAETDMCLPYSLKRLEEDRYVLAQKFDLAQRALAQEYGETDIIGKDPRTAEVLGLIRQVGPTPTTVLIRGESGTGKELTARAIHKHSQRSDKPLVTVNCTTLTDSLLESELFGHKKGSFTGAHADKKGLFEAANGGTIFLDEIGDITPKLQAELLRVLDSGEIRPVGGNSAIRVDVRLIAATNKNLEAGVKEGWFREDLYYRLNVFTVTMPPLRNRIESLPTLVHHFLARASNRINKSIRGIEDRAIAAMLKYPWPGNIRELQNVIERAAVLSEDDIIRLENLPVVFAELALRGDSEPLPANGSNFRKQRNRQLGQFEKGLLQRYLKEAGGNVSQAARLAQIPRRTFYRLLERNQIEPGDMRHP